jgi:hypothetical protein
VHTDPSNQLLLLLLPTNPEPATVIPILIAIVTAIAIAAATAIVIAIVTAIAMAAVTAIVIATVKAAAVTAIAIVTAAVIPIPIVIATAIAIEVAIVIATAIAIATAIVIATAIAKAARTAVDQPYIQLLVDNRNNTIKEPKHMKANKVNKAINSMVPAIRIPEFESAPVELTPLDLLEDNNKVKANSMVPLELFP